MLFLRLGTICMGALALSACSIHPLPNDYAREATHDIVEAIRCETRRALIQELLDHLEKSPVAKTQQMAADLRSGRLKFKDARPEDLDEDARRGVEKFRYAGIAYAFTLTITENDNATGNAALELPLTYGTVTLGLKAGAEKKRIAERVVKVSDAFGELVTARETDCSDYPERAPNFIYPITGEIGIDETIATFIKVANETNKVGEYSDELTFTTKLLKQIKPAIKLTKVVPNQVRLASADMDLNADRQDVHKVKLVLTDQRKKTIEYGVRRIKLTDGVTLEVPFPKEQRAAPVKKTSGKGAFGVTTEESEAIKRNALEALDRSISLKNLETLQRIEGFINQQ